MAQDISSTPITRRYLYSSSFKMALLFTVLLSVVVIILGYLIHYFSQSSLIRGAEDVIDTEIHYLLAQPPESLPSLLNAPASHRAYLLTDSHNKRLAGTLAYPDKKTDILSEGLLVLEIKEQKKIYAAKIHTFDDGGYLIVAVDITTAYHDNKVILFLGCTGIILMIIVILISFLISAFVVDRTRHISKIAHDIMQTGNLSQRTRISSPWDDLSYMAQVLNALLERIEGLVQNVKQVSDNIAHDLRTPLTRLQNNIEQLRQSSSVQKDLGTVDLCDALMVETDNILKTFNALLRIARIEAGKQKSEFSVISLHDLVQDVISLYEPLAEEKKISLSADIAIVIYEGDRDLLFQALANLLDNAIKFTPEAGTIELNLQDNAGIVFSIRDSGAGIPSEERDYVFRRFYRLDTSRHIAGNGLGLSLVAAVITLHDGRIMLEDGHPGLRVTIFL